MLPSAPSFAVTAKEKMATCKFGADDQKLAGAARTKFMKKCMANKNDPRGRRRRGWPGADRRRAAAAEELSDRGKSGAGTHEAAPKIKTISTGRKR